MWFVKTLESPIGPILLSFTGRGLQSVQFAGERSPNQILHELSRGKGEPYATSLPPFARELSEVLSAYFEGERVSFQSIPLDWDTGTPFQRRTWETLREVRYGVVLTYGELAQRVGVARGARAVGRALGANPTPIVVPCHRVVAASGRLGGFTGGTEVKRALLLLEGVRI